jgi:hypothetical protein
MPLPCSTNAACADTVVDSEDVSVVVEVEVVAGTVLDVDTVFLLQANTSKEKVIIVMAFFMIFVYCLKLRAGDENTKITVLTDVKSFHFQNIPVVPQVI